MGITPVGTTGRYSIARTSMPIVLGPSAAVLPRNRYHRSPIPRLRPPPRRDRDPPPPPPPPRCRYRRRRRDRGRCCRRRRDRPAAQDTRGGTRGADLDVSRTSKVSAAATTLHDVAAPRDLVAHNADLSAGATVYRDIAISRLATTILFSRRSTGAGTAHRSLVRSATTVPLITLDRAHTSRGGTRATSA